MVDWLEDRVEGFSKKLEEIYGNKDPNIYRLAKTHIISQNESQYLNQ